MLQGILVLQDKRGIVGREHILTHACAVEFHRVGRCLRVGGKVVLYLHRAAVEVHDVGDGVVVVVLVVFLTGLQQPCTRRLGHEHGIAE